MHACSSYDHVARATVDSYQAAIGQRGCEASVHLPGSFRLTWGQSSSALNRLRGLTCTRSSIGLRPSHGLAKCRAEVKGNPSAPRAPSSHSSWLTKAHMHCAYARGTPGSTHKH